MWHFQSKGLTWLIYWVKTRTCFSVKIPVEWDINQLSRWNLHWDTVWRSYMPKKTWILETGISSWQNEKNWRKIGFAFSMLPEWWKWKMLRWLIMRHCVWTQLGIMWRCRGVSCTKNYLPPSGNEEYYRKAPQCKTLCSRMLCWFSYFTESRACWTSIFLPWIEYGINIELECYHSYNNCYVLITRTVSLLSPYHHTHTVSQIT